MVRWNSRIVLVAAYAAAVTAATACGGGLTPAPAPDPIPVPRPLPVPVPVPVPMPLEPAVRDTRLHFPLVVGSTVYRVAMRAELERDSAGRKERDVVETSARVELSLRRDARGSLRGVGRVDSFTVRANGASARSSVPVTRSAASNAAPLFTSVACDAILDSTQIRTVVRPPLPNECDRPEAAAASMGRELLVRLPEYVSVGDTWRDSLVTLVCRGSVPMTLRTNIVSSAVELRDGGRTLLVRQTTASRLDGTSRTPWRQTDVTGDGTGTQDVLVDVARGAITSVDGQATLTVRVTNGTMRDAAAVQTVRQTVTVTVRGVK